MDPVTIGLGALQVGSQIFSAVKNARQQRLIDREIKNEQQHNEAVRGLSVSRSFADTNAAKSMFEKLRKNQQEANKNVENRNEVLGGTAEAEIAAKGKIQENTNEAVADMTGQATQWQDMKDRQYENRRDDLYRDKIAQREKKIDSALNLHENASNLLNAAGFMNAMNTAPQAQTPTSSPSTTGPSNTSLGQNVNKSLGLKITIPKK